MKIRISILLNLMIVGAMILPACSPISTPVPQKPTEQPKTSEFDWKRLSGEKITFLANEHGWTNGLRPFIKDFEEKTGIKVDLQAFAEDVYYDKMELALRSEKPVVDVYMQAMDSNGFTQWSNKLLSPLSPYLNDTTLTSSDYDLKDFSPGYLQLGMFPPGDQNAQVYGIPIVFETYILFYNKDLVNKYLGGKIPQTMEELVTDAQKITAEAKGEAFGAVVRGVRSDTIMDTVTGVVLDYWDQSTPLPYCVWFDNDWKKPRFNDSRNVQGLTTWVQLMKAGPSNIQSIDWYDGNQLFLQGKVAFYLDASMFSPAIEDASKSQVAGKTGYSPLLKTKNGTGPATAHWGYGLGIPANSIHKEAAWYFIQWATSKEMEGKIGKATGGATRMSTWKNPDYVSSLNPDYVKTLQEVLTHTYPSAVFYPGWKEYSLMIVDAIQEMYTGGDPQKVMDNLQTKVEKAFNK